ncbi:hypothetical protein QWY75_06115 [Pontixanthobacter aestiaquae]|uniref:Helix-turn-helix domain-containing protein n=1 Tax=Pontixanthobacter aestiaquae TaxID=1509367 RepID=A0A844ZBL1_9SPHN|nr:hypothetical protein [Pontixanthobacter aestiaquae]MDN3645776.1 hypothetical protein [Pontixanthobacter aestiaquae]MXO83229.1 hypothetical protein [Pontixanthobacter aestiaquae]
MAKNSKRPKKPNATGRNDTERFVKLDEWMLRSKSYRLLSAPARALLVEFLRLYNGSNNGHLWISQRDAALAIGVRQHSTAAKYIDELIERGFLKIMVPGSFNNKTRHATTYALTMHKIGEAQPTKEFMDEKLLSKEEKRRAAQLTLSWRKKKPSGLNGIPAGYLHEYENQPRRAGIA